MVAMIAGSVPDQFINMQFYTGSNIYLEQAKCSGLTRIIIDVLFSISQQHLQLCIRDAVFRHTLHYDGYDLKDKK